jgi:formate--tetrahydrofolate ligase
VESALKPVIQVAGDLGIPQDSLNLYGKQRIPFAVSTVFEQGGQGALELARQVKEAANQGQRSRPIYPLEAPIEQKLEAIAKDIYGATGVDYGQDARKDIQRLTSLGLINEPVCVAKTPLSLTDEPDKIGRPREFSALVRRMHAATGAGFNIAYMSDIVVMPGLPKVPSAETIKLSGDGIVTGVF